MKQVTIQNYTGEVRVLDVPSPEVPDLGVLVAVRVSVLSAGTERAKLETGSKSLLGKARARPDQVRKVVEAVRRDGLVQTYHFVRGKLEEPSPMGYSLSGKVVAVGEQGGPFRPGDRVACAGAQHAFHASLVAVPKNLAVGIPESVSDEAAAYATVGAIAMQGLRRADVSLGEAVVVIGLGLVGQLAMQLASAAGCIAIGTDQDARKCRLAVELSGGLATSDAEALVGVVNDATRGRGADVVLLCAATDSDQPVALAARLSRDKGRAIVVGDVGLHLARAPFYDKELDLRLSRSYGPGRYDSSYEEAGVDYPIGYVRWTEGRNLEAFLDLCASGKIDPSRLTTHRFPIEEAPEAYATLRARELALGVVLAYEPAASSPAPPPKPTRSSIVGTPAVAFVGAGNFAVRTLIPAFRNAGAELRAIASDKGLSARNAAASFSFGRAVSGIDEAIGSSPDALVIATRHDSHAAHTIAAAAAGIHVFCEKPLCLTQDELDEVVRAVDRAGVFCFVGFNRRYAPLTQSVLGHLAAVSGPRDILIRVNAGALEGHWLTEPDVGGGRWVGEGCHFVDLAFALAASDPTFVSATAVGGAPREAGGMHAVVEFSDGSTASIVYTDSGDPSGGKELVEVHGGGRSAVIDDFRSATLYGGGRRRRIAGGGQDKGHNAEVQVFVEGLKSGRSGFAAGVLPSMRVTLAAVSAAAVGGRVKVDAAAG